MDTNSEAQPLEAIQRAFNSSVYQGGHVISRDCQRNYYMWPDLPKPSLRAHKARSTNSLPWDSYTIELSLPVHSPAKDFLVCFSCGWFCMPVRRPRVPGWSLNGSGVNGQAANQLEITTRLASDIRQWFAYILWYLQHKQAWYGYIFSAKVEALNF